MHGARTHGTDSQATLQVPWNVTWNSATCDLLCHASRHDTRIGPYVPIGHSCLMWYTVVYWPY